MPELQISQGALQSLAAQDQFIRALNRLAADRIGRDIDQTLQLLREFPRTGRSVTATGLRVQVTRRFEFRVVYRARPEVIEVLDVLPPRHVGMLEIE